MTQKIIFFRSKMTHEKDNISRGAVCCSFPPPGAPLLPRYASLWCYLSGLIKKKKKLKRLQR